MTAYLLEGPAAVALYRAPVPDGGGAVTNAALPSFRFRFSRLRSRADRPLRSSHSTAGVAGVTGEGTAGVLECDRAGGERSFLRLKSTSMGETDERGSSLFGCRSASLVASASDSTASSLSMSISSAPPTLSRKSRPSRPMASLRARFTSAELASIPLGFANSLPEEARRRAPFCMSSWTEKGGKSGGDKEKSAGGLISPD